MADSTLDPQTLRESSSYALLVNGISDENSRTKLQNVVADSTVDQHSGPLRDDVVNDVAVYVG